MAAITDTDKKVADLIAKMTPLEKIGQMIQIADRDGSISFDLSSRNLGFHNSAMQYVVEPGKFHLWVGGILRRI